MYNQIISNIVKDSRKVVTGFIETTNAITLFNNSTDKETQKFFITDLFVSNGHLIASTWVKIYYMDGATEVVLRHGYCDSNGGGFNLPLITAIECGAKRTILAKCSDAAKVVVNATGRIINE